MDCPNTRLDPRVKRTRKLLQDALRALMHEKSFGSLTVQDITERATVNRATFYAHYTDKEELASDILRADLHDVLMKSLDKGMVFNQQNLLKATQAIFEFIAVTYDACPHIGLQLQNALGRTLQENIYGFLSHWMSESPTSAHMFPESSKETVLAVLSWSIYGRAQNWTRSPNREPASKVCRETIAMLVPAHLAVA